MELKILNQVKSALPRTEVEAHVTFADKTPSRRELQEAIAKKAKGKPELVVIKSIKTKYGSKEAFFNASVYDNKEAMTGAEQAKVLKKNEIKKEKAEDAPQAEEKKE